VERTAVRGRLNWQFARVVEGVTETARTKSIALDAVDWPGHLAGQHVDVRLTADDGYQAQRSYSIASAPEDDHLMITVQRLEDGEVSPYLTETLVPGDQLELRGPIGGYFVWHEALGGPLLLIAGGSGIVPLRAILRHHRATASEIPVRLLYSARTRGDLIYREELANYDSVVTLTNERSRTWTGHRGRIDSAFLTETTCSPAERPLVYICGPTGFVEAVADALVTLGHDPSRIRAERFGPT
jgi:ferredoxin-NADP reductase